MNLAFDAQGRPLVIYVRNFGGFGPISEPPGYASVPEIYLARFTGTSWTRVQLTNWNTIPGYYQPLNTYPITFLTLTGPHVEGGVQKWYTKGLLYEGRMAPLDTGWLGLNPATLQTTPQAAPSLPRACDSGSNAASATLTPPALPLCDPEMPHVDCYEDTKYPGLGFKTTGRGSDAYSTSGTPQPSDPTRNDAQDYYYLRWEAIDRGSQETDPAAPGDPDPPTSQLTLHRTTCLKTSLD